MQRYELIVIGAGPAGLSAAIQAAEKGMRVVVFDENARPGGQLFKQIHKFFGSKEHKAKIRGFVIGQELLARAEELGVQVELNATVIGMYREKEICVMQGGQGSPLQGRQYRGSYRRFREYGNLPGLGSSRRHWRGRSPDYDEPARCAAGQKGFDGRFRQRGSGGWLPAASGRL